MPVGPFAAALSLSLISLSWPLQRQRQRKKDLPLRLQHNLLLYLLKLSYFKFFPAACCLQQLAHFFFFSSLWCPPATSLSIIYPTSTTGHSFSRPLGTRVANTRSLYVDLPIDHADPDKINKASLEVEAAAASSHLFYSRFFFLRFIMLAPF